MNKDNGGPDRDEFGRFLPSRQKLRDRLAEIALRVILDKAYGDGPLSHWTSETIAEEAYAIADAMLAERAK